MLCPQFWTPVLFGYPDVIGVMLINIILFLNAEEPIENLHFLKLAAIALLLSSLILLRRWYAYWVLSFLIALAIERFIFSFSQHGFKMRNYLYSLKNILIMAAISGVSFFIIAEPIAKKMLLTNHADIFSAYRHSNSTAEVFMWLYHNFGFLFVSLFVLGVIQSIMDEKMRRFILFLVLQFVVCLFLFSRTQDFSEQHYYLLMPTIIIFISLFFMKNYLFFKNKPLRTIFLLGACFIFLLNFLTVFIPKAADNFKKIDPLLSKERFYPLVRTDISEIYDLLNVLEGLYEKKSGPIYVLASSLVFNEAILRGGCSLHQSYTMCDQILPVWHVDKRDGFPPQFLSARYVIVSDPIQYHLRPEDQRIIGVPADQLLHERGIGSSYRKLPYEFTLDKNVKVFIYEKYKPFKEN